MASLWLDNPERRSAMGAALWDELPRAMRAVSGADAVHAVAIAARVPHFTTGLVLKAIGGSVARLGASSGSDARSGAARRLSALDEIQRLRRSITSTADCPKLVIAAALGYCLGGGIDLITACDIHLASADSVFSVRENRIAIIADVGTPQRLPAIAGKGIVAELVLTGDDIDAERAWSIGVVNGVYENANATLKAAFLQSNDLHETLGAFMEKREPVFKRDRAFGPAASR